MKSFFKNVLANIVAIIIIGALFVISFIMLVAVSALSGTEKIKVKENSVLTLDSKTNFIDSPNEEQQDILDFKNENKFITVFNTVKAIEKAKVDDKIKGISIENDFINAGLTQIDDVRNALEDFKKSGKFVYAYGNTVSQPSYILGSVADKYFLNPAGGIELKGLSREVTFYKQLLEKFGIGVQVIRHGKYKSAVEPFLRTDISPENNEQLSTLLNDLWRQTSSKVSASRKMDTLQFKTVVDSLYGIIPQTSIQYKLADQLIQKTQYDDLLKNKLGLKKDDKLNKISLSKYSASIKDDSDFDDEVAVLYASGTILNGNDRDQIHSEYFIKQIKKLEEDDDVKAVVLRVNSPGGSANAADEILFQLQQLKSKKPLVVSFGDYAASGGYYIAMAGNKIYSEPNTLTGSIGVFGTIPYFKQIAERNGLRSDIVKTNANSNFYSPIEGLSPGALSMLTKNVEQTYKRFVGFVMQNRKMSFSQVDGLGGGRVWSGSRAKKMGLVDEIGTLNNAVIEAAKLAKMAKYNVEAYPKKVSKFEQIFGGMDADNDLSAKLIKSKLGNDGFEVFKMLTNENSKPKIMMSLPHRININ